MMPQPRYRSSRSSTIGDLLTLASRIPWWLDLVLLLVSYVGFHMWHIHLLAKTSSANTMVQPSHSISPQANLKNAIQHGFANGFVFVGVIFTEVFQYLIPVVFFIGGLVSFFRDRGVRSRERD